LLEIFSHTNQEKKAKLVLRGMKMAGAFNTVTCNIITKYSQRCGFHDQKYLLEIVEDMQQLLSKKDQNISPVNNSV